eukprot:scaffold5772_cov188-Amphora_coffeaeformis.AAC.14
MQRSWVAVPCFVRHFFPRPETRKRMCDQALSSRLTNFYHPNEGDDRLCEIIFELPCYGTILDTRSRSVIDLAE